MTGVQSGVETLRGAVDGAVSMPGEAAYDTAVSIWNGVIERRPAVVVSCVSSGDVAAALAFARDRGLEVSVRGGGHNYAGHALCDGGLMIDLTPMKSVVVDAPARRVVCGGGTTWGELDAATQEHGLAVPGGFISTTGVAGLALGGGFGWLSRLAGLTSDNLLAAEVVTADGRVLRAASDENEDLFWALRGGGGNFGVVTSFEFGLTPVGPLVHLGMFMYAPEQGGDVFRFAREYVKDLPERLRRVPGRSERAAGAVRAAGASPRSGLRVRDRRLRRRRVPCRADRAGPPSAPAAGRARHTNALHGAPADVQRFRAVGHPGLREGGLPRRAQRRGDRGDPRTAAEEVLPALLLADLRPRRRLQPGATTPPRSAGVGPTPTS